MHQQDEAQNAADGISGMSDGSRGTPRDSVSRKGAKTAKVDHVRRLSSWRTLRLGERTGLVAAGVVRGGAREL